MGNPSQLPKTSNTRISKRPRKPRLGNVDGDKQRERKRFLDRRAQRASREKTRTHIAHLEEMVQLLSNKSDNTATGELIEKIGQLHAEIDQLRKVIDSIKFLLHGENGEALDSAARRQRSQSSDEDAPQESIPQEQSVPEASSPVEDSPNTQPDDNSSATMEDRGYGAFSRVSATALFPPGYSQMGNKGGEGPRENLWDPESNNLSDKFYLGPDMRTYGAEKIYLQNFSEFIGPISIHQVYPNEVSAPRNLQSEGSLNRPYNLDARIRGHDHRFHSCISTDESVIDLFDELPPS